MKILSARDIIAADQFTIENEPIKSIDLMERAALKCFDWMTQNVVMKTSRVIVFAGVGNNGGDGLVIARKLASQGIIVTLYLLRFSDKTSPDFQHNFELIKKGDVEIIELEDANFELSVMADDVIVDAIFGSGLNKPVEGWLKEVIDIINTASCLKIAIDIPSGLFADDNRENDLEAVVKADVTLTFQNAKLAFVLESSGQFCGEWEVLDIGLDKEYVLGIKTDYYTLDLSALKSILKERKKFGHKGNYGHALIVAGSKGKMGASVLATRSCLKSGIGLLTNLCPAIGYEIIQNSIPEAMAFVSDGDDFILSIPADLSVFNSLGVGPGLGQDESAKKLMIDLFNSFNKPMVIDADALNVIAGNEELLSKIPQRSILTPHPGEFKRLAGPWKNDHEKLEKQIDFSKKYKVILVLKGAHTSISSPEGEVYFNTTGNPGMATAGSGDVLLGMITGLLGRGYSSLESAKLGVYLHGLAGDFAASQIGEESVTAGDIVEFIPDAFQMLYGSID